jgi:hypothetical protein
MEETTTPLIDQAGGQVANAVNTGQQYSVSGPVGFGNAVGLTANGAWQLSAAESAELGSLVNNFTVASWVYIETGRYGKGTAGNARFDRIIGDDVAWDGDGWAFGVQSFDGHMVFTKNGVADVYQPGAVTVPVGQWVHLAATVSSTAGVTFFVNGNAEGNANHTANGNVGDDAYGVGRAYGIGDSQWFPGRLDEVYVYNTVLSQSEIQASMIPEPSTALLGGLGLLALARRRRR